MQTHLLSFSLKEDYSSVQKFEVTVLRNNAEEHLYLHHLALGKVPF